MIRLMRCRRVLAGCFCVVLCGCSSPLDRGDEQALREQLIASQRRQLQAVAGGEPVQVTAPGSVVEQRLGDERVRQLDERHGLAALAADRPSLGSALDAPAPTDPGTGGPIDAQASRRELSLEQAVQTAVRHNPRLAQARLRPAIAQSQVLQAEAAFDAVAFGSVAWSSEDTPQPAGTIDGLAGDTQSETLSGRVGVRDPLLTGGEVELSTQLRRLEQTPSFFATESFYDADVVLTLRQPLLRGFGEELSTAQIVLAQSLERSERLALRSELMDVALEVEQAYWELDVAWRTLAIQQRLLDGTAADRDLLAPRFEQGFDVTAASLANVDARVQLRRSDLIRARQAVRSASDRLKVLLSDPDLPVAGEAVLVPTTEPAAGVVRFSLLDAVTTAMRRRPELSQALLQVRDAGVRQRVADNSRLPALEIGASIAYSGIDTDNGGGAYEDLSDLDYIDYALSAVFEQPLGARAAGGLLQQRRLERQQAVLAYQDTAQQVVLQVKNALRDLLTNYELIAASRSARRAAAEALRAISAEQEAGVALTPEFIDRKLARQDALAEAQRQEVQAAAAYNTSLAQVYRAIGTLLERDRIEVVE
jgi:outer membrane protein TolC